MENVSLCVQKRYFRSDYTITAAESTAAIMLICQDFRSQLLARSTDLDNLLLFMKKFTS